MKDSRDITDGDREKILRAIEEAGDNKFIITHGTYTMAETARFLKGNLKRKNLTIILTGAITPLKFENSDAPANLKFAIDQLGQLPSGVYICINGRVLESEEAVKNIADGKFYSKSDKR